MLACVPSMVVVRVGSDDTMSPFRLQVIVRGLSPLVTTQVSCTNSPWLTPSLPTEKGTMTGFSANKILPVPGKMHTIDFQFCRVGCSSYRVLSSAGVHSTVLVIHRGDHENAGLCSKHCCGYDWVRADDVSLQTPGDRQWFVPPGDHTGQLREVSLINNISPK